MSTHFKRPISRDELHQLQRDTTALLRKHRVRVALNKLCPRHKSEDAAATAARREAFRESFKSDDALIAAAGQPAKETVSRYFKRGRGVFEEAHADGVDVWQLVLDRSSSVDSWYTFKAGLQFFLIQQVSRFKRIIDDWDSGKRPAPTDATYAEAKQLALLAPTYLPALANALAATPEGGAPEKFEQGGHKRCLNSKSWSIKRRADDWREQIASIMEGDMKLLFLMHSVTGCRPVELKNGVTVELTANDEILFAVKGAKLGKHSGQSLRSGRIEVKTGVAGELAKLLTVGQPLTSAPLIGKVDTYRKSVARTAERVFPGGSVNRRLTGYSLRHQMKADLRAMGLSREKMAEALGHATTKSATYYGTGGRAGKGAVTLRQVSATRPVKQRVPHRPKGKRAEANASVSPSVTPKLKPRP